MKEISIEDLNKLTKNDLKGKIICFPTDTVYGVGCMIDDEISTAKIYQIKKRDLDKPLANLVGSIDDVYSFAAIIPDIALTWMKKYWPGALTIIFNKKENIHIPSCKNINTIGLRMPNSKVALAVLKTFGPMATTSVNISNQPPLNNLDDIKNLFGDEIDYYVTDKEIQSCVSSTVVDISKDNIHIVRQGNIKLV